MNEVWRVRIRGIGTGRRRAGRALAGLTLGATLAVPAAAMAEPAGDVAAYEIVDGSAIPESLTGEPGDPEAGRRLYFDDKLTRCVSCHDAPEVGGAGGAPPLAGIARRLSEGEIRLWLVAPEVIAPGTRMPGYYLAGQRDDPTDPRYGGPWLSAVEIEDLVAYLMQQGESR